MKILYVDLEYDHGMKHRGPNVIGQGFKKSFVDLGHEVDTFIMIICSRLHLIINYKVLFLKKLRIFLLI
ncbi:MAG: hypothetical protein R3A80_06255 [Bdellovibrionota bacterium]